MGDLFMDHFHLQGVDILILGRDEHGSDTNDVEVGDLSGVLLVLEEAVQDRDGQEEGLVVTLEVGQDFDHPVNHAGPKGGSYFVLDEAVLGVELDLELSLIDVDVLPIVVAHVGRFALNLSLFHRDGAGLLGLVVEDGGDGRDCVHLLLEEILIALLEDKGVRVGQDAVILLVAVGCGH